MFIFLSVRAQDPNPITTETELLNYITLVLNQTQNLITPTLLSSCCPVNTVELLTM